MRESSFNNLFEAREWIDKIKTAFIVLTVIVGIVYFIIGVVVCATMSVLYGVALIFGLLVGIIFVIFTIEFFYLLITVLLDALFDIKYIGEDTSKIRNVIINSKHNNCAYEIQTNYFLYYAGNNLYLKSSTENVNQFVFTNTIDNAKQFVSKKEVEDYLKNIGMSFDGKWCIVEKQFVFPRDKDNESKMKNTNNISKVQQKSEVQSQKSAVNQFCLYNKVNEYYLAGIRANGEIMISKKIEQALKYECKEKAESQAAKFKLDLENTWTIVQEK